MEGLAGVVLLLLALAIAVNVVNHGPAGAKAWARAKFLGRQS